MANRPQSESGVDIKEQLKGVGAGIKEEMVDAADAAKQEGLNQMAGITRAVHGAADQLGRELPGAADYVHSVADRLESASSSLRERSIDDLVSSFSSFARRQPAAAFAGSVVVGFALSRLLKASVASPEQPTKWQEKTDGSSPL